MKKIINKIGQWIKESKPMEVLFLFSVTITFLILSFLFIKATIYNAEVRAHGLRMTILLIVVSEIITLLVSTVCALLLLAIISVSANIVHDIIYVLSKIIDFFFKDRKISNFTERLRWDSHYYLIECCEFD